MFQLRAVLFLTIIITQGECHLTHHHRHPHLHDQILEHLLRQDQRTEKEMQSSGPSIISLTRFNRDVNGPTIFNPDAGRSIRLEDYPNYSVLVPLSPNSATSRSNDVFISRKISGPGEFKVIAPEGHGVMAVVQTLDLRPAPTGCNDFIQFGEVDSGVETTSICGKVDKGDGSVVPSSLTGPRVFLSPSGKMKVLFYHGFVWGLVRDFNFDLLDPSRNPMLGVELVFTAYKECGTPSKPNGSISSPFAYRSCTPANSVGLGKKTCIPSQLFCDKVINCAFEESFGLDEHLSSCLPRTLVNLLLPSAPPPPPTSPVTPKKVVPVVQDNPVILPLSILQHALGGQAVNVEETLRGLTATIQNHIQHGLSRVPSIISSIIRSTSEVTSSTTTVPPLLLQTKEESTTSVPFRTQLHEHIFHVVRTQLTPKADDFISTTPFPSVPATIIPTAGLSSTSTTKIPITPAGILISNTESHPAEPSSTKAPDLDNKVVQLPLEFEQLSSSAPQEEEKNPDPLLISRQSQPDLNQKESLNVPKMILIGEDFSAEEGKEQTEELATNSSNKNISTDDNMMSINGTSCQSCDNDNIDELKSTSQAPFILWFVLGVCIILAASLITRMYCSHNHVIWIPNPRVLRTRKRKRETSVYGNHHLPQIPPDCKPTAPPLTRGKESMRKETPPSYDILFPKANLYDADVLP